MSNKPPVNAPCPCGSGKKFKKCHGDPRSRPAFDPAVFRQAGSSGATHFTKKTRTRTKATDWQQNPGVSCPCGSSIAYRSCCEPLIESHKGSQSLLHASYDRLKADDIAGAEELSRAHFIQYLQWIHEQTLPLLATGDPFGQELVQIDVDSLIDNIDSIAYYRAKLNREAEIIPFIDTAGALVPFPGFDKHVAYLRATWMYIGLHDKEGSRRELKELGNILEYGRRQALELYMDVLGEEISEREKIALAEAILAQAGSEVEITLQYTALRALSLLQIGEREEALKTMRNLLRDVTTPVTVTTSEDLSITWQLAKAWALFGKLTDDAEALEKAEDLYKMLPESMLTSEGVASLQLELGWLLRDEERFGDAIEAYRRSLSLSPSNVAEIHLAHALVLSGELDEPRSLLRKVYEDGVEHTLSLEYFAAVGALAVEAEDNDLAVKTVADIRTTVSISPYWEAQKSRLIIELMDFVQQPKSMTAPVRQRRIVGILLSINEMVEIKPNFFGLGLNLNKMIEKLAQKFDSKQ